MRQISKGSFIYYVRKTFAYDAYQRVTNGSFSENFLRAWIIPKEWNWDATMLEY